MDSIKFGTGGWRAIIGEDFTYENVCRVAQGISQYAIETNQSDLPIVIGYDNRYVSLTSSNWITKILLNNGISVLQITQSVPTPLTMSIVKERGLYFGIEITASHNPYYYNGIKLFTKEGRDASIEVTSRLEEIINSIDFKDVVECRTPSLTGELVTIDNPFGNYVNDILSMLDVDAIKSRGLKVLVDPMYGTGFYPLNMLLGTTQCVANAIHSHRDGTFGRQLPAPSESTLTELKERVVEEKYDLGIALDGDGDRLGIIDSTGRYITANEILCLLYYYLIVHKGWSGPVVRNFATTHMLDKIANDLGYKCYEVPIGFKHISSKIDEVDAILGGESSGGLTVRGHIHGKDSIYAAMLFIEMVCATKISPSELMDCLSDMYGKHYMEEYNVEFTNRDNIECALLKIGIQSDMFNEDIKKVSFEDGCKIYFNNGFVICRFSGTEPLLRIFAESDSKEKSLKYIEILKEYVQNN
jgi:phosphomannomutase